MIRRKKKKRGNRVHPAKRYQQFWGVPPRKVTRVGSSKKSFVGLGRAPAIHLANGPKGKATKVRRVRLSRAKLITNSAGKRFWIWFGKKEIGRPVRFLGYVAKTEYAPTAGVVRQGSPKSSASVWQHKNGERGGNWPKLYEDKNGNYVYGRTSMTAFSGKSTALTVGGKKVKWLRN